MSRNDFKLIAYVSNVWCPIIISPTILSFITVKYKVNNIMNNFVIQISDLLKLSP